MQSKTPEFYAKDVHGKKFEISGNAPIDCPFHVGQKVMFTNDYGIIFGPYRVQGFDADPIAKRQVYLDWSSPWFPAEINQLKAA